MSEHYTVAVLVDLDEHLDTARRRGPAWAAQAHARTDAVVRAACADDADLDLAERPPDSWLITISRPVADSLAARAHTLACDLRNRIAADSSTTASIAISSVMTGADGARRAVREARATMGRKALGGCGRVLAATRPKPVTPPDITAEVTALLRAGATDEAVVRVERWIAAALYQQASPALVFGAWLPGLVLGVAAAVAPSRTPDGSPNWGAMLTQLPIEDLAELGRMHERSQLHRRLEYCLDRLADTAARTRPSPLVERAEALLRARFTDPALTLTTVAAELAVSPYHLAHVLQRECGTTFRGYLTALRVRQAVALLDIGRLAVGDVGERCGFTTARQFRATMKRETGLAPSQLRRSG